MMMGGFWFLWLKKTMIIMVVGESLFTMVLVVAGKYGKKVEKL